MKLSTFVLCLVAGLSLTTDASSLVEVKKKAQEVVSDLSVILRESTPDLTDRETKKDVGKKPWFCHSLDCPDYSVINKTKFYELREYEATRWVSAHQQNISYDEATETLFMKLFRYIEGKNKKNETIAMTAPVTVHVLPGQGPACANNFTMSFYMAPKVTDPPAPVEDGVFLSSLAKQKFYVSSFGGRIREKSWLEHADIFAKLLAKDGRKFDSTFFYTAGYDSPFRLLFRHNEIWFAARD